MSRQEIIEKVNSIILKKLDVEYCDVYGAATLNGDLGADSLDLVEIIIAAEHKFGICITDEETEAVKTVGDIYDLVATKVKIIEH